METDPQVVLECVHAEIRQCERCPLHVGRTNAVPGIGPLNADIMFIGEAPGFHEDQQGVPFVGAAGKFLADLLAQAGIDRHKVFITNVLKCRPPGNRDPQPEEVEACKAYLDQQIEIIRPRVIVTLGRHSMARAFPNEKISLVHGKARKLGEQVYFPMYHPAAALHQPSLRPTVEEDFARLRELLEDQSQAEDYTPPPQAAQLALF